MSRVFLVNETRLKRQIVVKVLPPEMAADVSIMRFEREIALAARLQHPHIVPLLATGETQGLPYYTMPFVEGESLRDRLTRVGELPFRVAAVPGRFVVAPDGRRALTSETKRNDSDLMLLDNFR